MSRNNISYYHWSTEQIPEAQQSAHQWRHHDTCDIIKHTLHVVHGQSDNTNHRIFFAVRKHTFTRNKCRPLDLLSSWFRGLYASNVGVNFMSAMPVLCHGVTRRCAPPQRPASFKPHSLHRRKLRTALRRPNCRVHAHSALDRYCFDFAGCALHSWSQTYATISSLSTVWLFLSAFRRLIAICKARSWPSSSVRQSGTRAHQLFDVWVGPYQQRYKIKTYRPKYRLPPNTR